MNNAVILQKDWRRFSDKINELNNELYGKYKNCRFLGMDILEYIIFKKSIENYWEWKIGKLQLDRAGFLKYIKDIDKSLIKSIDGILGGF